MREKQLIILLECCAEFDGGSYGLEKRQFSEVPRPVLGGVLESEESDGSSERLELVDGDAVEQFVISLV
jgi:hypothetical protein